MPETTARIAAALLAATFAWAGVAKLIGYDSWRAALAGYRLPATVERIARPAVPLVELTVVALLATGMARAGAAVTIALIGLFSFALARGRAIHGDRLPCGCFGGRDDRSATAMMWRNGILGLLALGIITTAREPELFAGFRLPRGAELLASAAVVVGLVMAAWMAWQVTSSFRKRQAP